MNQANELTDLLLRAPLAGFLAITIVALVAMFGLLIREKNAHQATVREVVTLTTALSAQWERQLAVQDRLSTVLEQMMARAQRRQSQDVPKPQENRHG